MHSVTRQRQRGTGTLEFTLAALPLLSMGMLIAETAHWHQTRLLLRHALHEAARAGSTAAASPQIIHNAFISSLPMPLRQRISTAAQWQLQVSSPTAASHADFGQFAPALSRTPVIRHDYQQEQHLTRLAQGWPNGRGPHSGQTIFEANTLHLTLDYPHRPWLPGLPAVPIHIETRVGMQSHAHRWPEQGIPSSPAPATPAVPPDVPAQQSGTYLPPAIPLFDQTTHVAVETTTQANQLVPIGVDASLCGIALCCDRGQPET